MKHKISKLCGKDLSVQFLGDENYQVEYICGLGYTNHACISFYKGDDIELLTSIESGILIVNKALFPYITKFKSKCLVFHDEPMQLFAYIVNSNHDNSFTDITLEKKNLISKYAYVESEVTLGDNVKVYPNATVYNGTTLGNNCIVQSSTVIGGIGMTYLKDKNNRFTKMTQLGNVVIEDDVEIGCNTTILRGILETTRIKRGTKIGNHVNIGHNCVIEENCYISAGIAIGGASTIGKNTWIAPGVSIRDHVRIAENCIIGVGSVVIKDTEPNGVYIGNPAKFLKLNNK